MNERRSHERRGRETTEDSEIHTDAEDEEMIPLSEKEKKEVRNKKLYKLLAKQAICVVPDPRIRLCNQLPHFSILYDKLRDFKGDKKYKLPSDYPIYSYLLKFSSS